MSKELYFLRSSEQKIIKDMLKFAYPTDTNNLEKYFEFYGLKPTDLGLYAMLNNEVAGAIWLRKFSDIEIPVMSVAIAPKYKGEGIGSFMMEQFLQEAGAIYEKISIDISHKQKSLKFYEKFGFEKSDDFVLLKSLEKKKVIRPSDGYDARKWMD